MAERRMVSKVISISEKVNSLSLFGRLLYTWMIPHADDFGRLPGSPIKIKALVVPMFDETIKDVGAALQDMHQLGIIAWYEVGGEKFIQITNFEDHQQGLHKRTKSKFPDPPTENHPPKPPEKESPQAHEPVDSESFREVPGNSEFFPLNRTELNRTETNLAATPALTREEDQEQTISSVHTQVFGTLMMNGLMSEYVQDLMRRGCSENFVMEAMLETGEGASKPNLKYLKNTAERWIEQGIASRAEAELRKNNGPPAEGGNARGSPTPQRISVVPTADANTARLSEIEELKRRRKEFLEARNTGERAHGT